MASGPQITLNGGITMTQVVVGDLIDDQDYNNMRENVNRLIGTPQPSDAEGFDSATTYGINQGIVDVDPASEGSIIYAQSQAGAIKDLQDDLQSLCSFYGITFRNGVGTDKTVSDSITAQFMNNIMLNIEDCWNTRFQPAVRSQTSTKAYTVADFTWVNSIGFNFAFEWSTLTKCQAFFNAGGSVYVSSTIGLFEINYVDFYSLTTTASLIGSETSSTSGVTLEVYAKIDETDPAKIIIETVHTALTNQSGTLTFNSYAQTPQSNNSGFVFEEPVNTLSGVTSSQSFYMNGPSDADEGDTFTITLNTVGLADASFPFTVNGVTSSDISPFTGNFTTINGEATVQFTVSEDLTTEDTETAIILLDNGEVSISVNIGDTSIRPPEASSITAPATVNETDSFTFSIQIDNPESETYTWTVSGSNSPTPNSGVFPVSGTIVPTTGPGQTVTFASPSISLSEDPDENAGSLTISVDTADSASATVTVTDTTIVETITSVVASPSTLSESGTRTTTVTVNTANVSGTATLSWAVNLLSAQSTDFENTPGTSGTVDITNNQGQFDIIIVDDENTESDETFSVSVFGPAVNNSVTSNVVTISANDGPLITSINSPSIVPQGNIIQVTVNTEYVPDGTDLTWLIFSDGTNGTTASSSDFVSTTDIVQVQGNQVQFDIEVKDSIFLASAATFQVNVSGSALGYALDATTANITIPATPVIDSVTRNISTVNEGGTVTFTVNTSNFPAGTTSLNWAVDNIETVNADFIATSGTVSIDGSVGSNTFNVTIFNDNTTENNETFTVSVSGPYNDVTSGVVTIPANDIPLLASIILPTSTVYEGDTLQVTVNTQYVPDGTDLTMTIISDGTNGTTASASDFVATTATKQVQSNQVQFDVVIEDDTAEESAETFQINFSGSALGYQLDATTANITIAASDTIVPIVDSVTSGNDTVNEGGTVTFTVNTSNFPAGTTSLNWAVNNVGTVNSDFVATSGTVSIDGSVGSNTFNVTIFNDNITENNETFTVSVSGPNNTATSNVITIPANDIPAITSVNLSTSTVPQGDTVQVTVNTEYVPDGTDLTWSIVSDGTVSASDFVLSSDTVQVQGNQVQFDVQVKSTIFLASAATFQVNVSGSALGYALDATSSSITIPATPVIDSVTRNISTVNEGGTVTFTVNTSNFPAGNTQLNWAVNNVGTVNSDFVATSGTVTIDGSVGSNTFNVAIFNDALEEPNETFTVTVSGTASNALVSQTSSNVTIAANDVLAYTLSLPSSVTEGNTLTLSLSAQNPIGEVVNWTLDSGDTYNRAAATSGTFGAVSGTTDTSTVSIDFDGIRRGSETWTFTATGATSGRSSTATVSVVDAPNGLGLSAVTSPINEGGTAQFLATTTNPPSLSNWDYIILQTGSAQHVTQTQLNSSPAITWTYSSLNDRYEANISVPTQVDRASSSGGSVGVRLRYNGNQVGSAVYVTVNNTISISYALDDETNNDTEITEGTTRDFDIVVTNPYPSGEALSWEVIPPGDLNGSDQAAYDQVSTGSRSGTVSYGAGQSTASFSVTTVYDSEYTGSTVLPIGTLRLQVTGQTSGVSSNVDVIDLINARADMTITSVSPSTITEGESFTVTVEGENIQGGEILRVNSGTGVYTSGATNGVEDFNLSFGAYNSSTGKYTATITVNTIVDGSVSAQDTIALSVINNANQVKDTATVIVNNAAAASLPSSIVRNINSTDVSGSVGLRLNIDGTIETTGQQVPQPLVPAGTWVSDTTGLDAGDYEAKLTIDNIFWGHSPPEGSLIGDFDDWAPLSSTGGRSWAVTASSPFEGELGNAVLAATLLVRKKDLTSTSDPCSVNLSVTTRSSGGAN